MLYRGPSLVLVSIWALAELSVPIRLSLCWRAVKRIGHWSLPGAHYRKRGPPGANHLALGFCFVIGYEAQEYWILQAALTNDATTGPRWCFGAGGALYGKQL